MSTTAALLIGGLLALLLVAYVFTGNTSHRSDSDPHCVSRESLGLVKRELFRRAAAVRGSTDPAFSDAANYSVLRSVSKMLRRHTGSHKVTCTGTVAIDLPPGVAAVGNQHSLRSAVRYVLGPARDGSVGLLELARADAIVGPLATVSGTGGDRRRITAAPPATTAPNPPPRPAAAPPAPSPNPAPAPKGRPPQQPSKASKAPAPSPERQKAPKAQPKAEKEPAPPPKPARQSVAKAKPSFNCRYAHTRGEVAVCGNPALAALDREMSAQFYAAMSDASGGQRNILRRTRDRFLAYRDSCGSDACIAGAYRDRMREISDIMAGRW